MIVNNSISNTLLQTAAPDHLRGRIMGFYSFVFVGMAPFGAFLFGIVAEHVGVPATIAAGARSWPSRSRSPGDGSVHPRP